MKNTRIIEMTGQLCFVDNSAALTLIPVRLTSWCFALLISCDWPKLIIKHRNVAIQITGYYVLLVLFTTSYEKDPQ